VPMRRLLLTNLLTAATVLAGATVSVAAANGERQVQGVALGAAIVLGSLLVRSVGRDLGRASQQHVRLLGNLRRQVTAARVSQGERIESEVARMTRRVLGDISAARLEQVDASDGASDS